jgi:hypothetical protein
VIGASGNAKCIVFAYLVVNDAIRFPIGWRVYKKGGPKKWELALELVDEALALNLSIDSVLFDSWYCVAGVIKGLKKRKIHWISELKSSHAVVIHVRSDSGRVRHISMNVAQFLRTSFFTRKEVNLGIGLEGKERPSKILYKTVEATVHVKALGSLCKLILSTDQRSGAQKILITDELSWESQKVLSDYSRRWLIEEFFKNAKGTYGLEDAYIRSEQGGALALFLVSFVDILISIRLWESIQKGSSKALPTVSAILAEFQEENIRELRTLLEDETQRQRIIESILASIERQKKKTRKSRKVLQEIPPPLMITYQPAKKDLNLSSQAA